MDDKVCHKVWSEFCDKLRTEQLDEDDFTDETKGFCSLLLCGSAAKERREKYLAAPFKFLTGQSKVSVLVQCPDDDYRFDFIISGSEWKLAFIECITLPVFDICSLPYSKFKKLANKETDIYREKEISKTIYMYNEFKKLLGQNGAIRMFLDGEGEVICSRSWVPFFDDSLSYIAYAAWMENRIYGEKVVIERFDEECSCLRFCEHIWRKMYSVTGHLRYMIDYDEYLFLFESIWKDRAKAAGWNLKVEYSGEDTILIFEKK